jgi:hypothetical protein
MVSFTKTGLLTPSYVAGTTSAGEARAQGRGYNSEIADMEGGKRKRGHPKGSKSTKSKTGTKKRRTKRGGGSIEGDVFNTTGGGLLPKEYFNVADLGDVAPASEAMDAQEGGKIRRKRRASTAKKSTAKKTTTKKRKTKSKKGGDAHSVNSADNYDMDGGAKKRRKSTSTTKKRPKTAKKRRTTKSKKGGGSAWLGVHNSRQLQPADFDWAGGEKMFRVFNKTGQYENSPQIIDGIMPPSNSGNYNPSAYDPTASVYGQAGGKKRGRPRKSSSSSSTKKKTTTKSKSKSKSKSTTKKRKTTKSKSKK